MIEERIDRTRFEVRTFDEAEADDRMAWMAKTPTERIEGLEYLRRWAYGDDKVNARLQRVFELVEPGAD